MSDAAEGMALNSFKILTPNEIENLLVKAEEAKIAYGIVDSQISASSIFGMDDVVQTEYKAKIIPITAKRRQKKTSGGIVIDGNVAMKIPETSVEEEYQNLPAGELENIGILSWDKIKNLKQKEDKKREASLPSSTAFLLDALRQSKTSNQKLSSSTAIKTYKSNNNFTKSLSEDDDEKIKLGDKGVLVDKDQH